MKVFFEKIIDSMVLVYINRKNRKFVNERGRRMVVFANDIIGSQIFLKGVYERDQLELLMMVCKKLNLISDNSTVLDIGANIGNHSLYFSKYFSKVLSFEANPNVCKILKYNVSEVKNIKVFSQGASNKTESLIMHENPVNLGGSSAVIEKNNSVDVQIDLSPLDSLVEENVKVDLIKVDVEGMEHKVFLGAENIISRNQPIIAFEQHESEFIDASGETSSTIFLKKNGYSFVWIEDGYHKKAFIRKFRKLVKALWQVQPALKHSDKLPVKNHSLVIALPSKFEQNLTSLLNG